MAAQEIGSLTPLRGTRIESPAPGFGRSPGPAVAAASGVNQQVVALSLSACLSNKLLFKNKTKHLAVSIKVKHVN